MSWRCSCSQYHDDDEGGCPATGRRRPMDPSRAHTCAAGRGHVYDSDFVFCTYCGYRPDEDPQPRAAAAPPAGAAPAAEGPDVLSSLRKLNKDLLGDIRKQVADSLTSLGAPARPVPPATPPPSLLPAAGAFMRATSRTLEVRLDAVPKVNYALMHAGLPLVSRIELVNTDRKPAQDVSVKVWLAPDYGTAWEKIVPSIAGHSTHVLENVRIPLTKSRLQEVVEAERASLKIEVSSEGLDVRKETVDIEVLAYNEWFFHPAVLETAACFVQPNSPAVERLLSGVRDRLRRQGTADSLAGYQAGSPARVVEMVQALYETLQQDARLSYINPPASFENGSQKVFLPEQIIEFRRGTCLDLAFLQASCLERMGLHPLFVLVRGHAFNAVWLAEAMLESPSTADAAVVDRYVSGKRWLVLNSTTCTTDRPFQASVDEGLSHLKAPNQLLAVVDIARARRAGFKPIPPLVQRT